MSEQSDADAVALAQEVLADPSNNSQEELDKAHKVLQDAGLEEVPAPAVEPAVEPVPPAADVVPEQPPQGVVPDPVSGEPIPSPSVADLAAHVNTLEARVSALEAK